MAQGFGSWIKRQAEIATSFGILGGTFVGVIAIFGGSFPPWQTPAQAQDQQRTAADIQEKTVQALGKINDKLDVLARRVDRGECNSLRSQLDQANSGLAQNPNSSLAKTLRDETASRMRDIQGCIP